MTCDSKINLFNNKTNHVTQLIYYHTLWRQWCTNVNITKCYVRQYELVDRYEIFISKISMYFFFLLRTFFLLSSAILLLDLTTWVTWRYLIRNRNCLPLACNWLYILYFDGGLFCPSFNFSLFYCSALLVIVLCLVYNEGHVWLNQLGSWITQQLIQAYHQYDVGSRPAL